MGEPTTPNREHVAETFATLRTSLRTERRRTAAERRAFKMFADRVEEMNCSDIGSKVPSTSGMQAGHAATLVANGHTDLDRDVPTEAIRRAYEETVMAVSFYDEEYGDDYVESLRAEFGPEVETALTDPRRFGPAAKTALIASIERAVGEREQLIEKCAHERESIDSAADEILPIAREIDNISRANPEDQPFGTLEAGWHRLFRLHEYCEAAAANRQSTIDDRRSCHDLPADAPDICAYLYKSHDSTYPVLAVCADLAERITTLQMRYERAMAQY